MDPTACFRRLIDALESGDRDEAWDASFDLTYWLSRGGAVPTISRDDLADLLDRVHACIRDGSFPIGSEHVEN